MNDIVKKPLYLIKYWSWNNIPRTRGAKPALDYDVAYTEEELMELIKGISGNYFIFTVGAQYESKEYFDSLFQQEKINKEREVYEKLKQKFEGTNQEHSKLD